MLSFFSVGVINVEALRKAVSDRQSGAVLVFEGTVRDHSSAGTGVVALEYEAKISMAEKVIATLVSEIRMKIPINKIALQHRLGRCELGEPTVVIAVSAAHRDEAYRASRLLIDRIKHEAPIWKREIFSDGKGQWSEGCEACTTSPTP